LILQIGKDKNVEEFILESTFSELEIRERDHIEQWIEEYPEMLGEDLLIVAKEYNGFDKTNNRLDLLAIDKEGKLVIIELKRDVADRFSDLQAIHYAAYCSTFNLKQIIEIMAEYTNKTEEEAEETIIAFIKNDEFIDFDDKPRIFIVSRDYQEETLASALWLRQSEIDINCVKLEPYKIEEKIVVKSDILVPLPETKNFMIYRDNKSRSISNEDRSTEEYHLKKASNDVKQLYGEMKERILDLGDNVEVNPRKWYIAFVSNSNNFLYVEISKKQIKFTLNLKAGELNDINTTAEDVSTIGHRGNGDYRLTVAPGDDLDYSMNLIDQAYLKYNSK